MTPPTELATAAAPNEARQLKDAALALIREHGTRSLTVDGVLSRAGLGTRAFYRHFTSKNDLIIEVFVRAAGEEAARLLAHMASARDPLGAVVAWIDCRLDLAFDPNVRSDLRYLSEQAQSAYAAAPEAFERAFATMLAPLIDALSQWASANRDRDSDATAQAGAIHNVIWGIVQRQWAYGDGDLASVRHQVVTFCLRGIGASASQVTDAVSTKRPLRRRRS
jgi:AcrR family transcriptional regulator